MFAAEVRFYREIAPFVGVRVPACFRAENGPDGTLLELEDLSAWSPGADPVDLARTLADLHARFRGRAGTRWPWLRRPGAAADLIAALYDSTWPALADHPGLTPRVRAAGAQLVGAAAAWPGPSGPPTLCHGDASLRNVRTGPDGEIALLDWEDVNIDDGVTDLAWLLVSSVEPGQWAQVKAAYGSPGGLADAWPDAIVQGLLSLADDPSGPGAQGWCDRLDAAVVELAY